MPTLTIPNSFTNNVSTVDATTMNANFNQVATIVNSIDNVNIGTLGIYASQIKPTTGAQATFGTGQNYTFPQAVTLAGGVATTNGLQTTTATNMGFYTGTGAPSFSAPNGTLYLRYDGGSSTVLYLNTSGASTSGTTWSAISTVSSTWSVLQSAIITYTTTGSETNGSPGTMATATFAALPTSPLTQWRITVDVIFNVGTTTVLQNPAPFGIGTATAGASPFAMFSKNPSALTITGGNPRSDTLAIGAAPLNIPGEAEICRYSALFANATTPSFTALLGQNNVASVTLNGMLTALAIPV